MVAVENVETEVAAVAAVAAAISSLLWIPFLNDNSRFKNVAVGTNLLLITIN